MSKWIDDNAIDKNINNILLSFKSPETCAEKKITSIAAIQTDECSEIIPNLRDLSRGFVAVIIISIKIAKPSIPCSKRTSIKIL